MNKRFKKAIVIIPFVLMFIIVLLAIPTSSPLPTPNMDPTVSYEDSLKLYKDVLVSEGKDINPRCNSKLLDHGKKTEKVVVLYHGFTNCPAQYDLLANELFENGNNVLVMKYPYHGHNDRMTEEVAKLKVEDMTRYVSETIRIASGLGERIVVGGISAGGVLSAWTVQNYENVDDAIIIAPSFTPPLPEQVGYISLNILEKLPNFYIWWDSKTKENIPGPTYGYPRFSTKAASQVFQFSKDFKRNMGEKVYGKNIMLISMKGDKAVNTKFNQKLLSEWTKKHQLLFENIEISDEYGLNHDIVDPNQPNQRTDLVYPHIVRFVKEV